ncbi:MAG: tetratricopeptide repeat protein, partial [Syntrophobacteraceae bacterium]
YEHALKWIKDGIQRFPKEIAFYELFSRYHHEQGRPYDAVGCLKRALTIDPSHVKSLISLGGLYETIGEFSDAIVYYEKAIKLSPDDPALHESLNRALKMKYKKQ